MNSNRVNRWEGEIGLRVEKEGGENRENKIIWLVEHLDEYMPRWLAFSHIKDIGVAGTLETDAFCILLGVSRVVSAYAKGLEKWFPMKEWEDFENALEYIQEHPSEENLDFVTDSFFRMRDALNERRN